MRFLKKYVKFLKENTLAPSKPGVKPAPTKPLPPVKPERKDRTIKEPKVKPGPKALKDLSEEVSYTFIAEMSKAGESVEKYLK
jgi:hypothetical protein